MTKKSTKSSQSKNESTDKKILLEQLVENHSDHMAIADIKGNILYANTKFATIFHKTKEEVIGTSGFDLLSPDTGKRRNVFITELINKKKEVIFQDHDLNKFWNTILKPIINENGDVVKIAVYINDITEQKKEEEKKLELKETFYHRLIRNSSDIFLILEKNGTIRFISESVESITGYKTNSLERKDFFSLIHDDDRDRFQRYYTSLLTSKKTLKPIEFRLKKKNDSYVYVESVGTNLLHDKQIKGIILTTRDIAERKKTEEQLIESEHYFKSLVSSMSEIIFLMDSEDRFIDAFVPKDFLLYQPKNEFINKKIEQVLPKEITKTYKEKAKNVRQNGKTQTMEYSLSTNGENHWFLATLDLYSDKKSIIISIIDITRRKQIEETLRDSDRLLRAIFNDPETFIGILDSEGNLLKANQTSLDFIGLSHHDVEGKKFWNTPWWSHSSRLQEKLKKAFTQAKKGKIKRFEADHIGKNNEKKSVLFCLRPVRTIGNNIVSFVAEGYEITKLKKAEQETNIMKNYLQDAINSTLELIIITDIEQRITFWNNQASELTGLSNNEVLGKQISFLPVFSNEREIDASLKKCYRQGSDTFKMIIQPKNKPRKLLRVMGSVIQNEKKQMVGMILVGRDITHESNLHGRLIPGKSYVIPSEQREQALLVFSNLTQSDYYGLLFTRHIHDFSEAERKLNNCSIFFFDDKKQDKYHIHNTEQVIERIDSYLHYHDKIVILIDRLDYLLSQHGFEQVMHLLYRLNSIITEQHVLLFVRINPAIFEPNEYKLIKEELTMLPDQVDVDVTIEKKLLDLLRFIYHQNRKNILVSFKSISRHFSITKVTTAKRIKELENKGLIIVTKRGRMKTSYITESGKILLQKRKVI